METTKGVSVFLSPERFAAVGELFGSPASDPRVFAALVLMAIIAFLLVILIILFIFVPRKRIKLVQKKRFIPADRIGQVPEEDLPTIYKDRDGNVITIGKKQNEDVHPRAGAARVKARAGVFSLVAALVLLIGVIVAYGYSTSDSYCANACHGASAHVLKAERVHHADCVGCHAGPRWTAPLSNTSFVLSRFALLAKADVGATPVANERCLHCHKDILSKTITTDNGIRMNHTQPVAQGRTCTSCHESIGHITGSGYTSGMAPCLECHNNGDLEVTGGLSKSASSRCNTCHEERVALSPQNAYSKTIKFTPVVTKDPNCGACHNLKKNCNPCHGLQLPHSKSFLKHDHARIAAFDGKKLCWKCHTEYDTCGKCHGAFNSHSSNWKTEHANRPNWRECGGTGCHRQVPAGKDICAACHTHYK